MKKIILLFALVLTFSPVFSLEVNPPQEVINAVESDAQLNNSLDIYRKKCSDEVQKNWKNSNIKHDECEIKISFKTLSDGTVQDIQVLQASKYEQNNQAAIKAINDAAPFEPIPEELNAQEAEHIMLFPCKRYAVLTPTLKK